ncbi:ABC transporter type 1, transmembrane domain-containing protein, partial [Blastocladiella britannica]
MISSDAHPDSVAAGSPMTNANVFSRLLFTWFSPLTTAGYRKPLEEPDLFPMGEALSARTMNDAFEADFRAAVATWRAKHPGTKVVPSSVTARALIKSFGRLSALGGLCKFIGDMCGIAIPILIKEVLSMVERCQQRNAAELSNTVSEGTPYCNVGLGYTLVVLIFLFQASSSLLMHTFWHLTMLTGLRVRNALITATFAKTLRLSNAARNGEFNTGNVVNIVSTDTNRLDQCQPQIHNLWTSFVLVVITMSVMVSYVGWPGLVGIGFMVAFLPVQSGVMTFIGRMRRASQAVTDKRIKLINELLQGIKVVKLLGWEKPSLEGIKKHREDELYYVTRVAVWKSGVIGLAHGVPAIAIVLVFSIYAIIPGNTLIPSLIFGSLSLLNLVRIPLYLIPLSYGYLVDANVSLRRITNLLTADEVDGLPTVFDSQNPELPAIQIKACSFTWDRFDDEVAPAVGPLLNESPKPKPGDDEGDSLVLTEEAGDGLHHAPSSNKNYLSDM